MLGNAYGLILFVMRDQTAVAALLDEDLTVDNENADLTGIDGVAFFNKHLVPVVVGRLHAVTADRNHEVRLLRFFSLFLVEEGAEIMVESTIVPFFRMRPRSISAATT